MLVAYPERRGAGVRKRMGSGLMSGRTGVGKGGRGRNGLGLVVFLSLTTCYHIYRLEHPVYLLGSLCFSSVMHHVHKLVSQLMYPVLATTVVHYLRANKLKIKGISKNNWLSVCLSTQNGNNRLRQKSMGK